MIVTPLIMFNNSASDNTINAHIIIYTQYKFGQLGVGFAWLKTLRTDSPTSGAFMEALTARGINSKPLREKLQARRLGMTMGHDPAQKESAIQQLQLHGCSAMSSQISGRLTTTHTTNGFSKSYNISKDLRWVFAC